MPIPNDVVAHIADLARLSLDANQLNKIALELNRIIEYVDRLSTVDTSDIDICADTGLAKNVFREDKITPSLPVEEALKNAFEKRNGHFIVPRVI